MRQVLVVIPILKRLESDTQKIISKTHGKNSDERFLFDQFGTKQGGNYFEF